MSAPGPAAVSGRRVAGAPAAFLLYLGLAVLATFPLARDAGDHLPFPDATPRLNAWSMAWVRHQLPRDPLHLFDGNAFYPYRQTLAFSEHLLVPALLGAPVAWLTNNVVLSHNLVELVTLATAGLGMYLLAFELTGAALPAFAAGILYAFHTWNINEIVRIQILSSQWFPFLLLALIRFFRRPSRPLALVAGLAYCLQSLSCMYWALYLPLLVVPTFVFLWWRSHAAWRTLLPLACALAAAFLTTFLVALPYLQTARELGFGREAPHPFPAMRYLSVLPENLLYGSWLANAGPNERAAHFLGFVALALGVLGGLVPLSPAEPGRCVRPLLLGLVAMGFLLSLGPQIVIAKRALGPGPYVLLRALVPGFRNVRYPERLSIFVLLGLAPLVAHGLKYAQPRIGRIGTALVCALLFIEHVSVPRPLQAVATGSQIPEVYRWLGTRDDVTVVAEVPNPRRKALLEKFDSYPMYFSTVHWKRTLEGFTGYFPPTYYFSKWRLYHFPDPESVRFLERFGVDTVVVDPDKGVLPRWAGPNQSWRMLGPFREGHVVLKLQRAGQEPYLPTPSDEAGFVELDRTGWHARASRGDAMAAIDGKAESYWSNGRPQARGDVFEVSLGSPQRIARITMSLLPDGFPMQFALRGKAQDGRWVDLPFNHEVAYDRLFASLLHRPRQAAMVLDIQPTILTDLKLRITRRDPYGIAWQISELRAYDRRS
jgi:hypothetical protein